jgi:hypothetical protein
MSIRTINLTVGDTPNGEAVTYTYPHDDSKSYLIPTYTLEVAGKDDAGNPAKNTYTVIRFGVTRPTPRSSPRTVGLANYQKHIIKSWIPSYTVHSARSDEKGAWKVYGNFLVHDGPDDPATEAYASLGCVEICGGPKGFDGFNDYLISLSGSTKADRNDKLAEIGASKKMSITFLKATRPPVKLK